MHKYNDNAPAIAYYRPDGHYVVVDRADQRLVAVSDRTKDIATYRSRSTFATDDLQITDPYVPSTSR